MKHVTALLIVIGFSTAQQAFAQTKLSWADAVDRVKENNPLLKSSEETIDASESQLKSAFWNFGPRLVGELSFSRTNRNSNLENDNASATVGIRQSLFDLGNFGTLSSARASLKANQIESLVTRAETSRDLKNAFARATFAQDSERLSTAIVERRKRNLDLVQLRYEGGRENLGALQLSKANYESAVFDQFRAKNSLVSSQATLRALFGLSGNETFELAGSIPLSAPPASIDLDQAVTEAPESQLAIATEEQSQASVTSARGNLYPSANLTASVGNFGDRFWPETQGWSAGVNLTIPLVDVSSYHQLQAAKSNAYSSSYRRKSTEQNLRSQLQSTYLSYLEADQAVRVAESQLKAARTRAEIARKRYETGLLSFDEWDRIETDLISRETAMLQANLQRVEAESAFEVLLGRGALQ